MKKNEKRLFTLSCAAALLFAVPSSASAMHIMEGYLPIGHAVAWGALCLPFLAAGLISIKRTVAQHRKALLILAMAGAYAFVLSALKIPSVTGSSSHPTGTGLGAIPVWPQRDERNRHHRAAVPGAAAGTRRADHAGRQHLLDGDCRAFCQLRRLSPVPQAQRQQIGFGLSGCLPGRPVHLLRHQRPAWSGPSGCGGRCDGLCRHLPGHLCGHL